MVSMTDHYQTPYSITEMQRTQHAQRKPTQQIITGFSDRPSMWMVLLYICDWCTTHLGRQAMQNVALEQVDRKQLTELIRMCKKGMAKATLTVEYNMNLVKQTKPEPNNKDTNK